MNKLLQWFKKAFPTTVHKWWRSDCKLWEEKIQLLWFFKYYKYSIFINGRLEVKYRLFMLSNPNYLKKPILSKHYIGRSKFEAYYNNSKWTMPTNYELNLDKP